MKVARPTRSAARARRRGGTMARAALGDRLKKGRDIGRSVKRMSLLAYPGPQTALREQPAEPRRPRRQQVMAVRKFLFGEWLIHCQHRYAEIAGKSLQVGIRRGSHLRRVKALKRRPFGN